MAKKKDFMEYTNEFQHSKELKEYKAKADLYKALYEKECFRVMNFISFISKIVPPIPDRMTLLKTYNAITDRDFGNKINIINESE